MTISSHKNFFIKYHQRYDKILLWHPGRLEKFKEYYGEENYITEYTYNDQNQVATIKAVWGSEKYTYDKYGRLDQSRIYHGSTTTPFITKSVEYEKPQCGVRRKSETRFAVSYA